MERPTLIIFDVNETLLRLDPLKASVGRALGGRDDLLPLWFSTMLHYSLVETLTEEFHPFGEIGTAALMMVAEAQGMTLTRDEAQMSVERPMQSLPPYSDVKAGLIALQREGFRLVSLSNSSMAATEAVLHNAGIADLFEKRYSVESFRRYKPHPDTYRSVLHDMGVTPDDALMVAAHAWDLAGAKHVGLHTAFIARSGKALYPNVARPDYEVSDLLALAHALRMTGQG